MTAHYKVVPSGDRSRPGRDCIDLLHLLAGENDIPGLQ